MIVRIQCCVDGTGHVKSKWAVYLAPNHLALHAGKLSLFELF